MLRGRSRIPVLAEVGAPAGDGAWALRRRDFTSLTQLLPRLAEHRAVAVAGEGEETAVAALAAAAAASASGRRTILVECDLARPTLAAQVGLAPAPGLHEYLRWEAEPRAILQPVVLAGSATASAVDPLVCVCGGRPASNAETLLGLQSFAHMVEKLRAAYELTLLLAPPLLTEPGAALALAAQADAALAALPGGEADRHLRRGLRALPAPTFGAVAVQRS